jgi:hypothetical protein
VPALGIGAKLRLVDPDEGDVALDRQRLHRAEHIARLGRPDAFLAGDQRDRGRPLDRGDAVIDLAREQAQREADHAADMGGQAFDRQMGLAGVGGAKDGLDHGGGGERHRLGATLAWCARGRNRRSPRDAPLACLFRRRARHSPPRPRLAASQKPWRSH